MFIKSFIFSFFVLFSFVGKSNTTQEQVYYKCFRQFTQQPMPQDDIRFLRVRNQELTGREACLDLLSEASEISGVGIQSKIGQNVVNSFQKLHLSWFPNGRRFAGLVSYMDSLFDNSMPAYYFTKNLLGDEIFSNIFTSNQNLKAIRDGGFYNYPTSTFPDGRVFLAGVPDNNNLVQTGQIIKIEEKASFKIEGPVRTASLSGLDIDPHLGGGVLGSTSYIFANGAAGLRRTSNGGEALLRAFTRDIFNQFLCREIPVIRPGDEAPFVHKTRESHLAFRNGNSCMGCHASIDPMANVYRNIREQTITPEGENISNLNLARADQRLRSNYLQVFDVDLNLPVNDQKEWPENDSNFHLRSPEGRLFFRNFDGVLINKSVGNLSELSRAILETDDVYACIASKYFNHLTGIQVNLDDLGSIHSARLSRKERTYRNKVIEWGRELRKNQSLKAMIGSMIESPAYLNPGTGGL